MSVNQGERKRELCWYQSLSTHSMLPEAGETFSPALFSLSSPLTSSLSSMGLFNPYTSLCITITTARTSPACPDGMQRRQPFHTAPPCHLQSQWCIFAIPQRCGGFFFFFSLLNGKQEFFYIITFKMKNSLKALSWIALIFASLLTLRLFFSCNFPQMLQVFLNSEKQGLQHTG